FGLPEVSLGLIPGYGGTQRLSRCVGKPWAKRLILTGEALSAGEAQSLGIATKVVSPEQLMEEVMKLAKLISSRAPRALAWAKECVNLGHEMDLQEGLNLEADRFAKTFTTEDRVEGIQAFTEK